MHRSQSFHSAGKHSCILGAGIFVLILVLPDIAQAQYYWGSGVYMSGTTMVGTSVTAADYGAPSYVVGAETYLTGPSGSADNGVACGWGSAQSYAGVDSPAAGTWRIYGTHSVGDPSGYYGCQTYGLPGSYAEAYSAGPAVVDYFYASNSSPCPGASVTLYWSCHACDSGNIDGVGVSGPYVVSTNTTHTYTLNVSGPFGGSSATTTLTVPPASTAQISASPTTICSGSSSTLSWSSTNAVAAYLKVGSANEVSAALSSTGYTVSPTTTTTYTFRSVDSCGRSASATATVTVTTVPSGTFSSDDAVICLNGSTILRWNISGATTLTIDGQSKPANSSMTVSPTTTKTYPLVATNTCGTTTMNLTVTVLNATLSASPTQIVSGNSATLTWTSEGATSVTVSGGTFSSTLLNGTTTVSPTTTTTYTVVASRPCGSVTKTVTMNVTRVDTITPTNIRQGIKYVLSVKGEKLSGASLSVNSNSGLTLSNIKNTDAAELVAVLSVSSSASLGLKDLTISTSAGSITRQFNTSAPNSPAPGAPTVNWITVNGNSFNPFGSATDAPLVIHGTNLEGASVSTTYPGIQLQGSPIFDAVFGTLTIRMTATSSVAKGVVDFVLSNDAGSCTSDYFTVSDVNIWLRVTPTQVQLEVGQTHELTSTLNYHEFTCTYVNYRNVYIDSLSSLSFDSVTNVFCDKYHTKLDASNTSWSTSPGTGSIEFVDSNGEVIDHPVSAVVLVSGKDPGTASASGTNTNSDNGIASSEVTISSPVVLPERVVPVIRIKVTGGRWGAARDDTSMSSMITGANGIWNPQSIKYGYPIRISSDAVVRILDTTTHPSTVITANINDGTVGPDGVLTQGQIKALAVGDAASPQNSTTSVNMYFVKAIYGDKGFTPAIGDNRCGIGDDALERTVAHEIGHVQNLVHIIPTILVPIPANLMFSGGTGSRLTLPQLKGTALNGAYYYLIQRLALTYP